MSATYSKTTPFIHQLHITTDR